MYLIHFICPVHISRQYKASGLVRPDINTGPAPLPRAAPTMLPYHGADILDPTRSAKSTPAANSYPGSQTKIFPITSQLKTFSWNFGIFCMQRLYFAIELHFKLLTSETFNFKTRFQIEASISRGPSLVSRRI